MELYIDSTSLPEISATLIRLPAVSIDHLGLSKEGFKHLEHLPAIAIVQLLADDEFGVARERYEKSLPKEYLEAFTKIEQQIGNSLIVAIDNGVVIGCLQLTIIPGISRLGATRGQIEGVRVDKNYRGKGVGEELFRYAINQAKTMGCDMI